MPPKKKQNYRKDERGASLVIALIALMVVSLLGAGLVTVTSTETKTTANYSQLMQARYAAEAGVQRTINWLSNNYTPPTSYTAYTMTTNPVQCTTGCTTTGGAVVLSGMTDIASNYPDAAIASAYNTALSNQALPGVSNVSYSTYATLLVMDTNGSQTWKITSQGTSMGLSPAIIQVVATYERLQAFNPRYNYAVFGTSATCASVSFGGGSGTDSFDSSLGSYVATQQMAKGDIGSNGNISLNGSGTVAGNLSSPRSGVGSCVSGSVNAETISGKTVLGLLSQLPAPVVYPTPIMPTPTPPTTAQNINSSCASGGISGCSCYPSGSACGNGGPFKLAPGTYGSLAMASGAVLHLTAGIYNINSVTLSGNGAIIIDSGPVIIYPAGQGVTTSVDLSGGTVTNASGIPANFQIVSASAANINVSGGSGNYSLVYAPNSNITVSGGGDLYGALVGSTINNSGGTEIHFDRSLLNPTPTSALPPFHQIGFSWSKF